MTHEVEELAALALGLLDGASAERRHAHLRTCESCIEQYERLLHGTNALSAWPDPVEVPEHVWERLRPKVTGRQRFWPFIEPVAELFELEMAATRQWLERLDDTEGWSPGPVPGLEVMAVSQVGRRARAAFLRGPPGGVFPYHRHAGTEHTLVLQGGYRESTGIEVWRGERTVREPGTAHALTVLGNLQCIAAVLVTG